jgi:hypothetical protein
MLLTHNCDNFTVNAIFYEISECSEEIHSLYFKSGKAIHVFLTEVGVSMFLQNINKYLSDYTVSHPKRKYST